MSGLHPHPLNISIDIRATIRYYITMSNASQDYRPLDAEELEEFLQLTSPEPNTGCWLWTGGASKGYGYYKHLRAHRVAFVTFKEEVPSGFELHHKCQNTLCVNPYHLELVTPSQHGKHQRTPYSFPMYSVDHTHGVKEVSVSLPEMLVARLDLHFYDPSLGKSTYGARSRLIARLLEEWLRKETLYERATTANTA